LVPLVPERSKAAASAQVGDAGFVIDRRGFGISRQPFLVSSILVDIAL
jgi:hypothetical protein